jgi:hypothetical protein
MIQDRPVRQIIEAAVAHRRLAGVHIDRRSRDHTLTRDNPVLSCE